MSPRELALDLEQFINRGLSEGWHGWPLIRCRIPAGRPLRADGRQLPLQAGEWDRLPGGRIPVAPLESSPTQS